MVTSHPLDLTRGQPWQYRLVDGRETGPWRSSLAALLGRLPGVMQPLPWPQQWRVFGRSAADINDIGDRNRAELPERAVLAGIPAALTIGGVAALRRDLSSAADGVIDLVPHFGLPRNHRTAWLFAARTSPTAEDVVIHLGADWWFQAFVDGVPVLDSLADGNHSLVTGTARRVTVPLAAGRHVIALRVLSGAGGWAVASTCTTPPGTAAAGLRLEARRRFRVGGRGFAGLTLEAPRDDAPRLNGRLPPLPLAGMRYAAIPGIPAARLRLGWNALTRGWSTDETASAVRVARLPVFDHSGADRRPAASGRLLGIAPAAVRIEVGPILGHAGPRHASVSCRTTAPCVVVLAIAGRRLRSPRGLCHRFTVRDLDAAVAGTLTPVGAPAGRVAVRLRPLPPAALTVALLGDASPNPQVYRVVARAIRAGRPDAAVYVGDVVDDGRTDHHWRDQFWRPAPRLVAQVPMWFVPGNHDEDAPLWLRLFCHPAGGRRWSSVIGSARFLGIDGWADWSARSANLRWLDAELARAREPFVFVCDHYPAFTSTAHGACGPDGEPLQRPVREARATILPLLQRHRVTAMINGHAHCYERSEPPGGVPLITTGGAGGYLYPRIPGLNPHSRVFHMVHHWCRLALTGERAELTAHALDGRVLDRIVFIPRTAAAGRSRRTT